MIRCLLNDFFSSLLNRCRPALMLPDVVYAWPGEAWPRSSRFVERQKGKNKLCGEEGRRFDF